MDDEKRDELLIRMDEKVGVMHDNLGKVTVQVGKNTDDIKKAKVHIGIIKWFGGIATALASYFGFTS